VCDFFAGVEVQRVLQRRGRRLYEGDYFPSYGEYVIAGMGPQKQTPRWALLRALASGGRLHVPDSAAGRELIKQLQHLVALTLPSGLLKIEGRQAADDIADALALAAEIAMRVPPTAVKGEAVVEMVSDGVGFSVSRGLSVEFPTFVKRYPNGDIEPAEIPAWHPLFEAYALEMLARGMTTPSIERWQRDAQIGKGDVTIRVKH
jgi:hypothetical protein